MLALKTVSSGPMEIRIVPGIPLAEATLNISVAVFPPAEADTDTFVPWASPRTTPVGVTFATALFDEDQLY